MKYFLLFTLSVLSVLYAFGQTPDDSVKVYFQIGRWQYDPALEGNKSSMEKFIDRVRTASADQNLERIIIRSYASPDGADRVNKLLSQKRGASIAALIEKSTGVDSKYIETIAEGEAWDELRRAVEANPDVPSRGAILDIIDSTPISVLDARGNVVSSRKKKLMDLRGGRPWQWMLANIFPKLRNSLSVSILLKHDPTEANGEESVAYGSSTPVSGDENAAQSPATDPYTQASADSSAYIAQSGLEFAAKGLGSDISGMGAAEMSAAHDLTDTATASDQSVTTDTQVLALKTNALYYGILMPNLELEWLINKNWSVAVEGNLAWWGSYKHDKSYRICVIDGEVRRWIKPREPWHGMYVGVIAGGGWYDFLKKTPGYHGWGIMSGLSVGYMWPVAKHLSLEAEIGAGYVRSRYKEYHPFEGHHIYQRTKDLNYFGPIKVKFSLVWRFLDRKTPKTHDIAL